MKTIWILLLMSLVLNAQENGNANQQIYRLLLDKHIDKSGDISKHRGDYEAIMKALEGLGQKRTITIKRERQIEEILGIKIPKDTLVFSTEYTPETMTLKKLMEMGAITAKEKKKIERALVTGYLIPDTGLKRYFENVRKNSPIAKDKNYMMRYFSKPIDLKADKKAVFSTTSLMSKKYEGGKAMGCATITFFSKKDDKWLIEDDVCYEMY